MWGMQSYGSDTIHGKLGGKIPWSHMSQAKIGTEVSVDIARQQGVGMAKVNDKIAADTDQNRKQDWFQESKLPTQTNQACSGSNKNIGDAYNSPHCQYQRSRGHNHYQRCTNQTDTCGSISSIQHVFVGSKPPEGGVTVKKVINPCWCNLTLLFQPWFKGCPTFLEILEWGIICNTRFDFGIPLSWHCHPAPELQCSWWVCSYKMKAKHKLVHMSPSQ